MFHFWIFLTYLGAFFACISMFSLFFAQSAPQQAAAAAVAVAFVVIPYVVSRTMQLSRDRDMMAHKLDEIIRLSAGIDKETKAPLYVDRSTPTRDPRDYPGSALE